MEIGKGGKTSRRNRQCCQRYSCESGVQKNRRRAILKRAIQRLYRLEVIDREQPTGPEHREVPASDQQQRQNTRSAAVLRAEEQLKTWMGYL